MPCSALHFIKDIQTNIRYLCTPAMLDSLCHNYTLFNIEPAKESFV